MADKTNVQTIPVELLLSHIGKQVKVDIEAHREKLEDEIAKRRQRLEELRARRMEVSANAVVDTPVEDTAATPPPLPVSVLDTAAELDDTGDDDWLMEMPTDEMGEDVMPSSLDTGTEADLPLDDFEFPDDDAGGDFDLPELDDDLLAGLPDLDDDAALTVAHNDTPATLDDSLSSGTDGDVITENQRRSAPPLVWMIF